MGINRNLTLDLWFLLPLYCFQFVLDRFCAYPTYQLHPSEIFAPYLVAFFCSYLCVIFSNSWLLSEEQPSETCGPFQAHSNATYSRVFHVLVPQGVGSFTSYIVSPWFLYFAIIILVYALGFTQQFQENVKLEVILLCHCAGASSIRSVPGPTPIPTR